MLNKISPWIIFSKERFPIVSHSLMILLFVGGHLALAHSLGNHVDFLKSTLIFSAMFVFFFKMRLYDEIKDYELDCRINPNRPLPRGLLAARDMKQGIVFCILLELAIFSSLGVKPFLSLLAAVIYSLFMYKEFFIPKIIRPHLTTYALVHTIVTIPMGLSIFSSLSNKFPWEMSSESLYFVICNWFVFNIFEFGRKTFTTEEERGAVESYSKIFSRYGAVFLVVTMSLLALLMLFYVQGRFSFFQGGLCLILALIGLIFSKTDRTSWGKAYRFFSSVHIILFYIIFIIEITLGKQL